MLPLNQSSHPELLLRVEPEEGRRTLGVDHGDEALRAVGAGRARDDAARLVRVVRPRVRDDLVVIGLVDDEHDPEPTEPFPATFTITRWR